MIALLFVEQKKKHVRSGSIAIWLFYEVSVLNLSLFLFFLSPMCSSLSGVSRNMIYETIALHSAWLASVSLWCWADGLRRASARLKWLVNTSILSGKCHWMWGAVMSSLRVVKKMSFPGTPHYSEKKWGSLKWFWDHKVCSNFNHLSNMIKWICH